MLKNIVAKFLHNENGATAVEYVLIIAGIAVVLVTAIGTFGTELEAKITAITGSLFGG
jgi:pilus assembly protein Flp/PilA